MLARLLKGLTGRCQRKFPSVVLILGSPSTSPRVLHIVPEDRAAERFDFTIPGASSTFKSGGAVEQSREQIGVVQLYIGDGKTVDRFLGEVSVRAARQHEKKSSCLEEEEDSTIVVQVLEEA